MIIVLKFMAQLRHSPKITWPKIVRKRLCPFGQIGNRLFRAHR
jgi:hypothetical protein